MHLPYGQLRACCYDLCVYILLKNYSKIYKQNRIKHAHYSPNKKLDYRCCSACMQIGHGL